MGTARRATAGGSLGLQAMLSFEPFTLRDLGSSQVFQTGETLGGAPLIDYQHPHDLIMGLAAAFERPIGATVVTLRGGLADAPALGPTPFMHRRSAELLPTAPLSHHQLDSSHISHGVVTAAVRAGPWNVEASVFRGREPDEDRLDLDLGALDSYALRGAWVQGATRAQVSVGWLNEPHVSEPGDVTRVTASIEQYGTWRGRPGALTLAWGVNRQVATNEHAWLLESTLGLWRRGTGYLRGEIADKHIIGAGGLHPPGVQHPHIVSTVSALTLGYQHELWRGSATRASSAFSVGTDITGYLVPDELEVPYGRPLSVHLYGRWVFGNGNRPAAVIPHH